MSVDKTLEERGKVYGNYKDNVWFRANTISGMNILRREATGSDLSAEEKVYFSDIIMKLARLAVTPDHKDSWHDLQGYAKLVEDIIDEDD